ncbi:MAG: 6-phosphogluconolactonase [Dissulfurispiraceae bacterium]
MDAHRYVFIFRDSAEIVHFMVKKWQEVSHSAIERQGYFAVALSGGKTPIDFYHALSDLAQAFPWDRTHIFLVDERYVPFSDQDSNYGMLRNELLNGINMPPKNMHPILTAEPTPEMACKKYEEDLRHFFRVGPHQKVPAFDMICLGIGEDGHTASLFPEAPPLKGGRQLAVPVILDGSRHKRITLTLRVLNNARNVLFLASGENKANAVKSVIELRDPSLPASMVNPKKGHVFFVLDVQAGSRLSIQTNSR